MQRRGTRLFSSGTIFEDGEAILGDFEESDCGGHSLTFETSGDGFADFIEAGRGEGDDTGTSAAQGQTEQAGNLRQGEHVGEPGN